MIGWMMAAGLAMLAAVPAMAQTAGDDAARSRDARAAAMFDRMDADRDGMVSRAEWDAARAKMAAERGKGGGWGRIDTDGDGRITAAEWQAAGRPAERFSMVDSNRDGVATREEMMAARKAYRAERAQ